MDMATLTTPIRALTSAGLMQLMWLASPALPVGGFAYSEGLEAAVDKALTDTENTAKDWLVDQLHLTLARSDLAVIAKAISAWRSDDLAQVEALNAWVLQTRETSELRAQTEQMGRSMLEWLRNHPTSDMKKINWLAGLQPTYPLAFSLAASPLDATLLDCVTTYAFGWAENMVQAAIKSVPLGQSAGQRILSALVQEIPEAAQHALTLATIEQNGTAASLTQHGLQAHNFQNLCPMLAILSAQHETQYSRLFRS